MNDLTFLRTQQIQLRHLLEVAGNDPVMKPQLKMRLENIEAQLAAAEQKTGGLFQKEAVALPRTAIFLSSEAVNEHIGVSPQLAGEALINYENMFREQAMHDEREAAKAVGKTRRKRGAPKPKLLFTGTPRGSFGLEFVPQIAPGADSAGIHVKALENVASTLVLVTENDNTEFGDVIANVPHGVLLPLIKFLTVLSKNDAELRLAFSDKPSKSLSSVNIKRAAERLEREVIIESEEINGTFRGLTLDSGYFDFLPDGGKVITGTLADELTEDDIDRIDKLTNSRCLAKLQRTSLVGVSGSRYAYVLIDAVADITSSPATSAPE